MKGISRLRLTEWMWLEARLSLAALKASKLHPYAVIYTFDNGGATPLRCWIGVEDNHGLSAGDAERDSKVQELVEPRLAEIEQVLAELPGLAAELDLSTDLVVEIAVSTDYVDTPQCRVQGASIQWLEDHP